MRDLTQKVLAQLTRKYLLRAREHCAFKTARVIGDMVVYVANDVRQISTY